MPVPLARFTFNTAWDEAVFLQGPASIFSVDHKGWLKVDPERTREIWLITGILEREQVRHFVLIDRATLVRTYLCVTHPDLALRQPRGDVREFLTGEEAWGFVQAQWEHRDTEGGEGAGMEDGG